MAVDDVNWKRTKVIFHEEGRAAVEEDLHDVRPLAPHGKVGRGIAIR